MAIRECRKREERAGLARSFRYPCHADVWSDEKGLDAIAIAVESLLEEWDGRGIVKAAADRQGTEDLIEFVRVAFELIGVVVIGVEEMVRECHVRGDRAPSFRLGAIIEPIDLCDIPLWFIDLPVDAVCVDMERS